MWELEIFIGFVKEQNFLVLEYTSTVYSAKQTQDLFAQ